mgnify:CR=1 FL=1
MSTTLKPPFGAALATVVKALLKVTRQQKMKIEHRSFVLGDMY